MRKRDGEECVFLPLVRLSFVHRAWPEKRPHHPQSVKSDLLCAGKASLFKLVLKL